MTKPSTNIVAIGWSFLTARQKTAAAAILLLFVFTSALEMVALSSAAPFVTLVVEPTMLQRSEWLQKIADILATDTERELIQMLGLIAASLLVLGVIGSYFSLFMTEILSVRIGRYLANDLLNRCLKAPYVWFLRQNAAMLSHRLYKDPTNTAVSLYPTVMELVYTSLLLVFAFAVVAVALPWQAIVAVAAIIAFAAVMMMAVIRPRIARYAADERTQWLHCSQLGVEAVNGIKDIQVKARQGFFTSMYTRLYHRAATSRMKAQLLQRAVPMGLLLTGQLGLIIVAVSLFGAGASTGEIASQVALLGLISARLIPALSRVVGTITKLAKVRAYTRGLADLRAELAAAETEWGKPSGGAKVPDEWSAIHFDAVSFSYPGTTATALDRISLAIARGQSVGVVGPSGAGKSTFVDILLGVLPPTDGHVRLDDTDITDFARSNWFGRIGYVPQSPFIANDTLRRNVAFGVPDADIDNDKVRRALDKAGLTDVVAELDDGLDTVMGDRGLRLSGGQRQRVTIARALYDAPDILVLDEATSSLDTGTEKLIQDTVAKLKGEVTTITVAHRISTIAECDTIFVLEDGRLAAQGTYQSLYRSTELFHALAQQPPVAATGQGGSS